MTQGSSLDYAWVLADLRARRAVVDRAIDALERVMPDGYATHSEGEAADSPPHVAALAEPSELPSAPRERVSQPRHEGARTPGWTLPNGTLVIGWGGRPTSVSDGCGVFGGA